MTEGPSDRAPSTAAGSGGLLRLIAFDGEDVAVISAHLQDAVLVVADMAFLPREKRFAALLNRFDWSGAERTAGRSGTYQRRRTALRFERVLAAQIMGFDRKDRRKVLALLAIEVLPATEPPAADVILHFAGGSAVRLQVECIEAELKDIGPAWSTARRPSHPEDATGAPGTTKA